MGDSDNNNKEVSKGKNISVVNKIMGSPLTLDTIQRPSLISADGKNYINLTAQHLAINYQFGYLARR